MPQTQNRPEEIEYTIEAAIEQHIVSGAKRLGYLLAAALNGVMLWIASQLLDWGWPGFLTPEFDDVLPVITVSFVMSIIANLMYAWNDSWPIKPIGELVTSVVGFVAAQRIWEVFPFEFSGNDWSWLVRLVLAAAMAGTAIGAFAQLVSLAKGPKQGSS
ncbi:MAG: hypothetical protein ACN4GZ_06025 [Acidimicrobiales bacterium]